jgi:hypothetical protein
MFFSRVRAPAEVITYRQIDRIQSMLSSRARSSRTMRDACAAQRLNGANGNLSPARDSVRVCILCLTSPPAGSDRRSKTFDTRRHRDPDGYTSNRVIEQPRPRPPPRAVMQTDDERRPKRAHDIETSAYYCYYYYYYYYYFFVSFDVKCIRIKGYRSLWVHLHTLIVACPLWFRWFAARPTEFFDTFAHLSSDGWPFQCDVFAAVGWTGWFVTHAVALRITVRTTRCRNREVVCNTNVMSVVQLHENR